METIKKMETITPAEFNRAIQGAEQIEKIIKGIRRGGYLRKNKFYFHGRISQGPQMVTFENK